MYKWYVVYDTTYDPHVPFCLLDQDGGSQI